jgi:hypothetical protein
MKRSVPDAACGFATLLIQYRCETASGQLSVQVIIQSFVILV